MTKIRGAGEEKGRAADSRFYLLSCCCATWMCRRCVSALCVGVVCRRGVSALCVGVMCRRYVSALCDGRSKGKRIKRKG
jgi:hypothetical protein